MSAPFIHLASIWYHSEPSEQTCCFVSWPFIFFWNYNSLPGQMYILCFSSIEIAHRSTMLQWFWLQTNSFRGFIKTFTTALTMFTVQKWRIIESGSLFNLVPTSNYLRKSLSFQIFNSFEFNETDNRIQTLLISWENAVLLKLLKFKCKYIHIFNYLARYR